MLFCLKQCSTKTSGTLQMYQQSPGLPHSARKDDVCAATIANFVQVFCCFLTETVYSLGFVYTSQNLNESCESVYTLSHPGLAFKEQLLLLWSKSDVQQKIWTLRLDLQNPRLLRRASSQRRQLASDYCELWKKSYSFLFIKKRCRRITSGTKGSVNLSVRQSHLHTHMALVHPDHCAYYDLSVMHVNFLKLPEE